MVEQIPRRPRPKMVLMELGNVTYQELYEMRYVRAGDVDDAMRLFAMNLMRRLSHLLGYQVGVEIVHEQHRMLITFHAVLPEGVTFEEVRPAFPPPPLPAIEGPR